MESACLFDAWLHEQGYTYHGNSPITGLTQFEIDKLQLGWIMKQEQEQRAVESETESLKRERYSGAKNRARERFKEARGLN